MLTIAEQLIIDHRRELLIEEAALDREPPTFAVYARRMDINAQLVALAADVGVQYPAGNERLVWLAHWQGRVHRTAPLTASQQTVAAALDWAATCGWPELPLTPTLVIAAGERAWQGYLRHSQCHPLPAPWLAALTSLLAVAA